MLEEHQKIFFLKSYDLKIFVTFSATEILCTGQNLVKLKIEGEILGSLMNRFSGHNFIMIQNLFYVSF